MMNGSSSSPGGAGLARTGSNDQTAAALGAASQAMKALEERGAKISEVAEKSEQLTEVCTFLFSLAGVIICCAVTRRHLTSIK